MKFKDLREFLEFLEERGELKRVSAPVSRDLEITEIADRMVKSGGPALLFENVEGFETPLAINLYGTHQRVAWALGVDDVEEIVTRIRKLTSLPQAPPKGLMDKLPDAGRPRRTRTKPAQDGAERAVPGGGAEGRGCQPRPAAHPDVLAQGRWPVHHPAVGHQQGPRERPPQRGHVPDAGVRQQDYRHALAEPQGGGAALQDRREDAGGADRRGGRAWRRPDDDVVGLDAAASRDGRACGLGRSSRGAGRAGQVQDHRPRGPGPRGDRAGGVRGAGERPRIEGPFGDHTGYYSLPDDYSVFHLTAITHRRGAIYPTTVVGRPPSEDYFMGKASEQIMLPALQLTVPEIVDMNMPAEGIFTNYVLVSIRKEYPGQAQKVMYALWGIGQMALVKGIVVFDEHVNIHDLSEAAWRLGVNIDPRRDILFVDGPADDLDHAASTPRLGSKVGIDATEKIAGEGVSREWPEEIVMSGEIKSLVDSRWGEYGL